MDFLIYLSDMYLVGYKTYYFTYKDRVEVEFYHSMSYIISDVILIKNLDCFVFFIFWYIVFGILG